MKRRSFIQATTAAFAAMILPAQEIFRKIKPTQPTLVPLPVRKEVSVDGRYVYNPGHDITGVQDLTFHQHSVIPGGKITRIDSGAPWFLANSLAERDVDKVRAEKNVFGTGKFVWGNGTCYAAHCYSAKEILNGLLMSLHTNITAAMLVELPTWAGSDIALDKINDAIYSDTLEGREEAIRAIRHRWMIRGDLQGLLVAIESYRDVASALLKQRIASSMCEDEWQKSLLVLLGHADEYRAARATDRLTGNAEEIAAFRRKMAERIMSETHDSFRVLDRDNFRARVKARMLDVG